MDTTGKIIKLKNAKGMTLIVVALLIVILIAFVGLGVDIGYMYVARGQLQNAADAAALAGAAKLDGTNSTTQTAARQAAFTLASSNVVVPATTSVKIARYGTDNTTANFDSGLNDILVGKWNGVSFSNLSTPVNAVKVRARRTEGSPGGQVDIFFAKVLRVIGMDWGKMSASATAIAARIPAPILPISVNEYWLQKDKNKRPYADNVHEYPDSFVRRTNVDGSASLAFGKIFGILGSDANDNMPSGGVGSKNMNGFVNMDSRTSNHDGSGVSWYDVVTGSATTIDCTNCLSGFTGPTTKNSGSISLAKFDANLTYLLDGYPDNQIIPIAVREQLRSPLSDYPDISNYLIPTSSCPFATNAYFSSSGSQPLNKKGTNGKSFSDIYPPGKKVVTMVYDGSFKNDTDPSMPNAITNVGYVLLQIDGYGNTNPKNLDLDKATTKLNSSGTTAYAHALDDIVQPSSNFGSCDLSFLDAVMRLRIEGATLKLVK